MEEYTITLPTHLLDDYMLELNLDYHYNVLMDRNISLERRAEVNTIYEILCEEKQLRTEKRSKND